MTSSTSATHDLTSVTPAAQHLADGSGGAKAPWSGPDGQPQLGRLRGFHPGWFGAVMGTAIVGVVAFSNPGGASALGPGMRDAGQVLVVLAAALALGLGAPYIARWFLHPDAALHDLHDPVAGALYGTFPGGILVLAAAAAAVGPSLMPASTARTVVASLAWVGVPLAFLASVVFASVLFTAANTAPGTVNGGWFIPPVVNIVVPMALVPLVPGSSPSTARLLLIASYASWGMGFLLFVLVLSMLHQRLVLHPLPPAAVAPSLWIGLGPVGVGTLTLLKMAPAAVTVLGPAAKVVGPLSLLAGTALWGFGAWWLVAATVLLVRYLSRGPLPFGLGWRAFTFPLGAFTAATLALAQGWGSDVLKYLGAALFVALVSFWLIVAGRTAWSVRTGRAWQPPLPQLPPREAPAPKGALA